MDEAWCLARHYYRAPRYRYYLVTVRGRPFPRASAFPQSPSSAVRVRLTLRVLPRCCHLRVGSSRTAPLKGRPLPCGLPRSHSAPESKSSGKTQHNVWTAREKTANKCITFIMHLWRWHILREENAVRLVPRGGSGAHVTAQAENLAVYFHVASFTQSVTRVR